MSISKEVTIQCDECLEDGPTEWTVGMVIQTARSEGWKIGKRHRCPDCIDGVPWADRWRG